MNKTTKRILNGITNTLVALVVLLALLLVGARVVGLRVFTVLSGSMQPAYKTGSLIYVKQTDPNEVKIGQPITFVLNEDLVVATHRVVDIDAQNQCFYTKGDANEAADGAAVHFNNLIGSPVLTIPYLGFVANYIQNPPGTYVAISAGAVLLLLAFLPDLFDKTPKKRRSRRNRMD